jgi:hypothetical protein
MMVFWTLRLGGPTLEEHAGLADWYKKLSQRPAFFRVASEIIAADRELSAPVEGAYGGGKWAPDRMNG